MAKTAAGLVEPLAREHLAAVLPQLSFPAAGATEASITATAEIALLALITGKRRDVGEQSRRFVCTLVQWLQEQTKNPSIRNLLQTGPALALAAPLIVRAALIQTLGASEQADDNLPPEEIAAGCDRWGLTQVLGPEWKQLEFDWLLRLNGLPAGRPRRSARTLIFGAAQLPAHLSEDDMYGISHEVFYVTEWGGVRMDARLRARGIDRLRELMNVAIASGHLDLVAELAAALRCLNVAEDVAQASAFLTGWLKQHSASPRNYHIYLTSLLAAAVPVRESWSERR